MYRLRETGAVLVTDSHYYPILEDDKWVATSVVTFDSMGRKIVNVSSEYAEDYMRKNLADTNVSILFDKNGAYVVTRELMIEAAKANDALTDMACLSII